MRNKERLTITISLVIAGLVLAGCWLWLTPKIEQLALAAAQKQAERQALSEQIEVLTAAKVKLQAGGSGESGAMAVSLSDLEKTVPPAQEVEDWYAMLENMAKSAQIVDPISITVGNITGVGLGTVPLSVSANGPYNTVVTFIQDFQTALRPMNIESIDLTTRDDGEVTADIKATAYVSGATGGDLTNVDTTATTGNALQATAELNPSFNANAAAQ